MVSWLRSAPEKNEPISRKCEGFAVVKSSKLESKAQVERRAKMAERRSGGDRRAKDGPVPVVVERRQLERREKVNRRRQIDPTTCERDYSNDEVEFMHALDQYKRANGRMFPTCSEILEVIRGLGYQKASGVPVSISSGTGANDTLNGKSLPAIVLGEQMSV
jgi:hypothetical protein